MGSHQIEIEEWVPTLVGTGITACFAFITWMNRNGCSPICRCISCCYANRAQIEEIGNQGIELVNKAGPVVVQEAKPFLERMGRYFCVRKMEVAYVVCRLRANKPGRVLVMDVESMEQLGQEIKVGIFPMGIVATLDGEWVYVANRGSHTVSVISTKENKVMDSIEVLANPEEIAVTPNGEKVYVTHYGLNLVSVIGKKERESKKDRKKEDITTIEVGDNGSRGSRGIGMSADGKKVYLANYEDATVAVIDVARNRVKNIIHVGDKPERVVACPTTLNFFCTLNSKSITFIFPKTGETKRILDGIKPERAAFSSDGALLYVTDSISCKVLEVDVHYYGPDPSRYVKSHISTKGKKPQGIVVDRIVRVGDHIARWICVANAESYNITRLDLKEDEENKKEDHKDKREEKKPLLDKPESSKRSVPRSPDQVIWKWKASLLSHTENETTDQDQAVEKLYQPISRPGQEQSSKQISAKLEQASVLGQAPALTNNETTDQDQVVKKIYEPISEPGQSSKQVSAELEKASALGQAPALTDTEDQEEVEIATDEASELIPHSKDLVQKVESSKRPVRRSPPVSEEVPAPVQASLISEQVPTPDQAEVTLTANGERALVIHPAANRIMCVHREGKVPVTKSLDRVPSRVSLASVDRNEKDRKLNIATLVIIFPCLSIVILFIAMLSEGNRPPHETIILALNVILLVILFVVSIVSIIKWNHDLKKVVVIVAAILILSAMVTLIILFISRDVPVKEKAYITDIEQNVVLVVDRETRQLVTTIPVGKGPDSLAVTSDQSKVYVANRFENTISVIYTKTYQVIANISVGIEPQNVTISPDGKWVYVSNRWSQSVAIISTETNQVIKTLIVGKEPGQIRFTTPDGNWACVLSCGNSTNGANDGANGTVYFVNVQTMEVAKEVARVGRFPEDMAVSPYEMWGYVTNRGSNSVSFVDVKERTSPKTISVGIDPRGVAIKAYNENEEDYRKAYVTNFGIEGMDSVVSMIDTAKDRVTVDITVGEQPHKLLMSPDLDETRLYVDNELSDTLSIIDTATDQVIKTITLPVVASPWSMTITSDGVEIYVTHDRSRRISIVDTVTFQTTHVVLSGQPREIVFVKG
jgi:YVTN family beta-propeller protein